MLVRIPLELRRAPGGEMLPDADIRKVFVYLGYQARSRQGQEDQGDADIGTAEHRGRATRNIDANMRDTTKAEIEHYGIFYGASSGTRCEIFVNRVNSGEVVVWLHQTGLDE